MGLGEITIYHSLNKYLMSASVSYVCKEGNEGGGRGGGGEGRRERERGREGEEEEGKREG